jgi:glycosyltransferase involved in cell wall biosynthesis
MKKLSVITINYNNAEGLKKTVESVLRQTYADFEYIVIDGGSTDGSRAVIEEFSHKITHWVSEKDSGIYNAMNKGITASRGEYLLFLNSGDCLFNEAVLTRVSEQFGEAAIIYGDIITQDKNKTQTYKTSPAHLNARHFMISTLWHPGSFIQRKLFEKYGNYYENYRIASDYEFFVKAIVKYRVSTKHVHLPIAVFDLNGISNNPAYFELMLRERKKIQGALFDKVQLRELERIQIAQSGQNSVAYKFVPKTEGFKKLYHKLFYYWYKWRVRH